MATTCTAWDVEWPNGACDGDPTLRESARAAAERWLWAATGRVFSTCVTTAERVAVQRACGCGLPRPFLYNGSYVNVSCDPCGEDCCSLRLPRRPVVSVQEIRVDGEALDGDAWWLDGDTVRLLSGCWPLTQTCQPSPVEADWTHGLVPPPDAALALGELASELFAGWTGAACRLPSRLVSMTRQGLTMDFADPTTYLGTNQFGLPITDAFVRSVNPHNHPFPPTVVSPDYR